MGLPTHGPASPCFEGDRVPRPAAGAPLCAGAWPSAGTPDGVWGDGQRFHQGTGMRRGEPCTSFPAPFSLPLAPAPPPSTPSVHLGADSALQKMWQVWGPSLLAGPLLSRPAKVPAQRRGGGHLWRGHLVSLPIGNRSQRESCVTPQGRGHVPSSLTVLTLGTRHAGFREGSARVVHFRLASLHVRACDGHAGRCVSE